MKCFEGVLFLTTNQIHMIDPAFISRVNLGMAFPELNPETCLQIRRKKLGDLGTSNVAWLCEDEQQLRKWRRRSLNGRQIRNVVYSARLLSGSADAKTTIEGIENGLESIIKLRKIATTTPISLSYHVLKYTPWVFGRL
ncbi:hypothetical protein GGR53DRAFT_497613 [Hypoxylon sp. FL1150]|nr:hypothetical protein GGR53DRAFT_497613 [Hypoxylon sp. FL1150]